MSNSPTAANLITIKNVSLVVHDVKAYLAMDFPPREVLLETIEGAPILTSQSVKS